MWLDHWASPIHWIILLSQIFSSVDRTLLMNTNTNEAMFVCLYICACMYVCMYLNKWFYFIFNLPNLRNCNAPGPVTTLLKFKNFYDVFCHFVAWVPVHIHFHFHYKTYNLPFVFTGHLHFGTWGWVNNDLNFWMKY